MRIRNIALGFLTVAASFAGSGARAQETGGPIEPRTAAGHPMHYFVSVPSGWTSTRQWPVLVVITDAERRFGEATRTFAAARERLPFVIVTPLVLGGGGTAQQHMGDFDYGADAWARASADGNCKFDEDGLTAVLADVRQRYHTEEKVFLAGWEAGGHVVLAQLFENPERLRAAVVATPNFLGRCMDAAASPHDAAARSLPVRVLHGSADTMAWSPGRPLFQQWLRLDSLARARGFTNVKEQLAPNRGHGPLAVETFAILRGLISP